MLNIVRQSKRIFNSAKSIFFAKFLSFNCLAMLGCGFLSIYIFILRSGWNHLKLNQPLMYFADPIFYANLVANAQQGNPLHGHHLGGLHGQQFSLSAYGFEWIQSSFVSIFASADQGPWLAMNRFLIYSYFATAICSFIAFRYLKIPVIYSFLAAITFALIPDHQPYSVGLANMSVIPITVAIFWKLFQGASIDELFPFIGKRVKSRGKLLFLTIFILVLLALFELTAATYYILLIVLFSGSTIFLLLCKPGNK